MIYIVLFVKHKISGVKTNKFVTNWHIDAWSADLKVSYFWSGTIKALPIHNKTHSKFQQTKPGKVLRGLGIQLP